VLAYTGLRWDELAALSVLRVDLLRRRIHVAESVTELSDGWLDRGLPKSHERRWVPLPRFLVDHLARPPRQAKAPVGMAFTSPRGAVLHVRGARRAWLDQAVELAG
jgi:integrase